MEDHDVDYLSLYQMSIDHFLSLLSVSFVFSVKWSVINVEGPTKGKFKGSIKYSLCQEFK